MLNRTLAPSNVRIAGPDDHQEIWRLFLAGHSENGIFTLAPDKVEWFIQRALRPDLIPVGDTGVRGLIAVIGPVGRLEGLCFITIGEFWYTRDRHIEEFIVYVDPDCRKSGHARALIEWMKSQVEAVKLPLFTGIISNERTEAKCRLYGRMLPKAGEFFFVMPSSASAIPAAGARAA